MKSFFRLILSFILVVPLNIFGVESYLVKIKGLDSPAFIFSSIALAQRFENQVANLVLDLGCTNFKVVRDIIIFENIAFSAFSEDQECSFCGYGFRKMEAYCPRELNIILNPDESSSNFIDSDSGFFVSVDGVNYYYSN